MSRILKSKKNTKFTTLFNIVLQKDSLSWAAKGLYAYIQSLPDDWILHKTEVQKHAVNGRTSFESAWSELERHGYLVGADQIRSSGKYAGRDYVFYDLTEEDKKASISGDSPMLVLNDPMHETNIGTDARNQHIQKTNNSTKKQLQNHKAYALCVDFWLKEFHPGWMFNSVQGQATKSIIQKIKKILADHDRKTEDADVVDFFKAMCFGLPEWFKTKDLQIIDSKFNEIIEQIKQTKNGTNITNTRHESQFRN